MSVVLGINAFHAGAAAAVVVDGKPIAAIAEERLNRVKYYAGFPRESVERCLAVGGLGWPDVDAVAVGRDSSANLQKKLGFAMRHPKQILNLAPIRSHSKRFDDLKSMVAEECGISEGSLKFEAHNVEHHIAHTASAYFMSEWDSCAGITIDGSGDFVSCLMSECVGNEIRPVKKIYVPNSLGTLYTTVCQFIGFGKYGDEGKVMGLAPLGADRYNDFFDGIARFDDKGFTLNPEYFLPFGANQGMEIDSDGEMQVHRHYSDLFVRELGEPRERGAEITERDRDLAFGVQRVFEQYYMHLLNTLNRLVPSERVAMAGGCVLNSVANGKVFLETPFKETCIQPAAGDDGLALGAALYVSKATLQDGPRWVMKDAYLGEEYADSIIESELVRYGLEYQKLERDELLEQTAEAIASGNIVGWFQGRMEWGPRALGNRSILAHPGYPNMKETLNARIKFREPFRPFAPSILAERQSEVFEQSQPSPFMTHVYKIRPEWHERLSAVNHVDGTGRLHTVTHESNPLYYDLITRFESKTGIPAVLNTSFNENEPIVCEPAQAIECFLRTKMDVLAIGSFFCSRSAS